MLSIAGLLLASAGAAHAQVTVQNPLSFGTIISGQTTNVLYTASGAARWRVHFPILGTGIAVAFTLPSNLTRTSGGQTMGITWPANYAAYRINNSNVAGAVAFTPATGNNFGLTVFALGADLYIWLGGRVSPPLNQTAGTYEGTVILTVTGIAL